MSNIDTRRRRLLKISATGAVGLTGLAGCLGSDDGSGGQDDTETTESGDDSEDTTTESSDDSQNQDVNVGMVYATGGLGDKSFNDMAQRGAQQAEDEYGISFDEAEPETNSDFSRAQRDYAESGDYDLISCIGFAQADALSENAPAYGDQNWMLVDAVVEEPNVANYLFREQDGSFQVGHLAGLLTTTDFEAGAGSTKPDETTVGFVGGVEAPLIKKFEAGFKAGVEHADDSIEVVTSYVGDFNDTSGGKEAALTMYQDSGADIVYHAAGATGVGVFQAAQQTGRFAIGVDADQSRSEPDFADVILASMVKRVDTAVYTAIENVVNDDFQGGGAPQVLGLEDDGVEAVYGDELGSAIPDDVKSALEESRQAIIDGDIQVPDSPE
jgi:basic membrane protein A